MGKTVEGLYMNHGIELLDNVRRKRMLVHFLKYQAFLYLIEGLSVFREFANIRKFVESWMLLTSTGLWIHRRKCIWNNVTADWIMGNGCDIFG